MQFLKIHAVTIAKPEWKKDSVNPYVENDGNGNYRCPSCHRQLCKFCFFPEYDHDGSKGEIFNSKSDKGGKPILGAQNIPGSASSTYECGKPKQAIPQHSLNCNEGPIDQPIGG